MKIFSFFFLIYFCSMIIPQNTNPCDSEQHSFSTEIFPIIEKKCLFCHNDAKADGGVNLKDYQHILPFAKNGQLLGSIKQEQDYMPMPPFGGPLSDCEVAKFQNWIEKGAKKE